MGFRLTPRSMTLDDLGISRDFACLRGYNMEHCRSPDGVASISVRPYYTMLSRVYLALAMGFLVTFIDQTITYNKSAFTLCPRGIKSTRKTPCLSQKRKPYPCLQMHFLGFGEDTCFHCTITVFFVAYNDEPMSNHTNNVSLLHTADNL